MSSSNAAREVLSHLESGAIRRKFATRAMKLPPPDIRELLELLTARKKPQPQFIFLREATDHSEARLVETWKQALEWLLEMNRETSWGSKVMRARVRSLAHDPRALGAVQAAVVSDPSSPDASMLAVLAADGSDESVDALLPVFAGPERYWMRQLKTHAADTPAMKALLEAIDARTEREEAARRKASVGLQFARSVLGLNVESFDVQVGLSSVEENGNRVSKIQGDVTLGTGFSVSLSLLTTSGRGEKSFHFAKGRKIRDEMKLGRCQLEDLPQWLVRAQKKLGITWATELGGRRGSAARSQFVDWLFAPTREANAAKKKKLSARRR